MKNSKVLIEYSNNMKDFYQNIKKCNADKECKVLLVFFDMIGDINSNKKFNQIVTELFIRGIKLNIFTVL